MNAYINLPVADLDRSRAFFEALGFTFNETFCDDTGIAMIINDACHVMLLTHEKFASFTPKAIADAHKTSETLVAVQLDSRDAVDRMVATALANGGSGVQPSQDHGFLYGHSFADPDGHIWEPIWMNLDAIGGAS
ncbi:MAG: VOC family protein [Pseudomonadota bacterium]